MQQLASAPRWVLSGLHWGRARLFEFGMGLGVQLPVPAQRGTLHLALIQKQI
jgi:hypothetical protein